MKLRVLYLRISVAKPLGRCTSILRLLKQIVFVYTKTRGLKVLVEGKLAFSF